MAILPADHGCSHTGIFPKAVRYRQMPEGQAQRERIRKRGEAFFPI